MINPNFYRTALYVRVIHTVSLNLPTLSYCLNQMTLSDIIQLCSINSPSIVTPTRALQLGYGQVTTSSKANLQCTLQCADGLAECE